jgi:hypothetical protein
MSPPIQIDPLLSGAIYAVVAMLIIAVWSVMAKDQYDMMAAVFVGMLWPAFTVLVVAFSPAIIGVMTAQAWKRIRRRKVCA